MPYARKPYRRFRKSNAMRRFKRKRYPNVKQISFFTPRNIYSAARYAAKGVNLMKGIVNSELKRYDTVFSSNPSSTIGITLITGMDQGDDVGNRNGNSILGKYITLNYTLAINASASATMFRCIMFVDGDNDGQTPASAELLANNAIFTSAINPDYTSRYTILYDQIHTVSINGERIVTDKMYRALNFHLKYLTGTGSTGFGRNNIWLLTWSNEATNTPTFTGYTRIAFYDN